MKSILFLLCLLLSQSVPAQDVCLTQEEQNLYNLLMQYRRSKNLTAIPFSARLTRVAQAHVRDLSEHFDYENRGDCNPHSWSSKGSWSSCCYTDDHNQASCMWNKPREISGYDSDGYEIAFFSSDGAEAEESLEGWKKSPGHNPVMINSGTWNKAKWEAVGIGIYGNYAVMWFGALADPSTMVDCK